MKIGVINAMEDEHARLASHLEADYIVTWKAVWAPIPWS